MTKRPTRQDVFRRRKKAVVRPDPEEPDIPPPPLHLGPWLDRLGLKQIDVAKAAQVGKSYMSQLCSRKKDDPSAAVLFRISETIGVVMNDLYKPPPPRADLSRLRQYDQRTVDKLLSTQQ